MRSATMVPALMLALFGVAAAAAEPAIKLAPAGFAFDGAGGEWAALPPAFTLVQKQPGARGGRVWLGQSDDGLIVAGTVDGPAPRFAGSPAQMPSGDHVELWVAIVEKPPMPPIGWGHQFGAQELKSAADCAKNESFGEDAKAVAACGKWYAAQLRYRENLLRPFARQWQLAPSVAVETWAKPAYDGMSEEEREAAGPLAPAGMAQAAFAVGGGPGYTFEIRVPWEAMPPANDLSLDRLRLMVDVFSPGSDGKYGPFSTTSDARKYARLDTLSRVSFDPPKRYRLARCGYPLEIDDFWYEKKLPAYFFQTPKEEIGEVFALENPVAGYQYEPGGVSPTLVRKALFSRELAPGAVVCGPDLAVRRGDTVAFSPEALRPDFKSAKVDGGWLLANGPVTGLSSRLGTGVCGACPTISLWVLYVPETDEAPSSAYAGSWQVEDEDVSSPSRNARVALADDLRSIRIWTAEPDDAREKAPWSFARFCYEAKDRTYKQCEERADVPPPTDIEMPPDE